MKAYDMDRGIDNPVQFSIDPGNNTFHIQNKDRVLLWNLSLLVLYVNAIGRFCQLH